MIASAASNNTWERLVLVGFMGAGKSTIGDMLASRLNLSFLDSDRSIEQRTARTIAELFSEHGETSFRLLEAEVIAELLATKQSVIALGGGALESPQTRALLFGSDQTCVIYLTAALPTMLQRCVESDGTRPLLQQVLRNEHALVQRHARRLEHYSRARITISSDGLTPEGVLKLLLDRLECCTVPQALPNESRR